MDAESRAVDLSGAIVVLDTNALQQTSLLRDPLSVSLLALLVQVGGSLGLPDIVRHEWKTHWLEHNEKLYRQYQDARRRLASDYPDVPAYELDVVAAAVEVFEARLSDLRDLLVTEPIADQDWQKAGQMVVMKRPPTTPGSQQLKDSLLWQALLRLGQQSRCILVSADKGFTKKGTTDLVEPLAEEALEKGAEITVVDSLKDILGLLQTEVGPLGETIEGHWEEIRDAFVEQVEAELLVGEEWVLSGTPTVNYLAFGTDEPGQVALAVDLESQLAADDDPEGEYEVYLEAKGSVLFHLRTEDLDIDIEDGQIVMMTPHDDVRRSLIGRSPGIPHIRRKFS